MLAVNIRATPGIIIRTFPVNGCFLPEQRAIYELVVLSLVDLSMINCALELMVRGSSIQEVGEDAVRIMVIGLVQLDVMKERSRRSSSNKAHRQFLCIAS